ncbi:hypothetical protein EXIGLDRAFT_784562 [Exidia glandulosa HHB12029]|uniref:C3H1-type domain-containing protein n=1 Tax=Exidia glandulosa HHB12029 TaxID=1314781 RepID=A0A166ME19_EXIGL|nr:hypothetical protein EXIGLDRAFT_784562 [Exidia glandulosa HHB12029]
MDNSSHRKFPQVPAPQGQQPGPQKVIIDPAVVQEVVKACTAAVTEYRQGKISKAEASLRCLGNLTKAKISPAAEHFGPYLQQLDEHDREKELAAAAASQPPPPPSGSGGGGALPPPAAVPARKRAHSPDEDDSDSDADVDADVGEHVAKRRYDPSRAGFAAAPSLNWLPPHVRKTLELRDNYLGDLKAAVRHLRRDGRAPPLPPALWPTVLADEYLDFDKLISKRFSRYGSDDATHDLGNGVSIKLPTAQTTRSVSDEGDWDHAYSDYKAGVVHAYPHRNAELESYGAYVRSLFRSTHKCEHQRVISADAAVRAEVANDDSLSFFDTVKLRPVFDRWLSPYGAKSLSSRLSTITAHVPSPPAASSSRAVAATRRARVSSEICERFNEGRCTHQFCRHHHSCEVCGSNLHGKVNHPADSAGEGSTPHA